MKILLAAILFAYCLPSPAISIDAEGRIILTDAEKADCNKGGGCVVMTRAVIKQVLEAIEEAKLVCRPTLRV